MLQSIQYVGSGPPTYVYSQKAVGASGEYYHVFASETRGYDARRERKNKRPEVLTTEPESKESPEEFKVVEEPRNERLQEIYLKEYGRRESFLWKQR